MLQTLHDYLLALLADIEAWPWLMVSAFAATAGLFIISYVNFFRPAIRRMRLKNPVEAYFLIPSKIHHDCSFARQDDQEHLTKVIVVPSNSELMIDFVFFPRTHFVTNEVNLGCKGDALKKFFLQKLRSAGQPRR
jgi:hypothetical protein